MMKDIANWMIRKWVDLSLVLRILIGLFVGAVLGLAVPEWTGVGIIGTVFVSALKAIAPVLVAVLVTASIAQAGEGLGPRFRTVILLYLSTTLLAAFLAVMASNAFPVVLRLTGVGAEGNPVGSLSEVLENLLVSMVANPVGAIAGGNYIGILFWAIVFGVGLRLAGSQATVQVFQDLAQVVSRAVRWIIQAAPFGILGLVFSSVSQSGLEIFTVYGQLIVLLAGCMFVHVLVTCPLVAFLMLRKNPYPLLFRCLRVSGLQAFFTRSSAANIPVNMGLCRRLGLNEDFYSVSIPLGATVNMNGAAITITVMTMAVAYTMGVEVSLGSALLLCVMAALGACGTSGVAGGSLLLVPMACSLFGISSDVAMQAVAVGFIIGVVQDSMETALNSSSDVFFTATAEYYDLKNRSIQRSE